MKKELLTKLTETEAKKRLRSNLGKHLECPKCQRKKYVRKMKGKDRRYYCQKCKHKFSLKSLVGFKHSNLELRQIYFVLYCFANNKTHHDVLAWAGISYPSSRLNYSRIRRGLLPAIPREKLFGDIVCDECYVGKRRTGNQGLIIGAVDRSFSDLRLALIPDSGQDSFEGFLDKSVESVSKVTTDDHPSYNGISWMGYGHEIENHSFQRFEKTVPIERVWGLLKTFLKRSYHHIHKEKIPEYLVEFQFKFIHRKNRKNPLYIAKMLTKAVPNS